MYRDLVEGKRWINEEDYKEGLAYLPAIMLSLTTLLVLVRFKKIQEPWLTVAAGCTCLLIKFT
jgi:hypothetical protein